MVPHIICIKVNKEDINLKFVTVIKKIQNIPI